MMRRSVARTGTSTAATAFDALGVAGASDAGGVSPRRWGRRRRRVGGLGGGSRSTAAATARLTVGGFRVARAPSCFGRCVLGFVFVLWLWRRGRWLLFSFGTRFSVIGTSILFRLVIITIAVFALSILFLLLLRFVLVLFVADVLPSIPAVPRSDGPDAVLLGDRHPLQSSHLVDATLRTIRNDDLPPPQQFLLPQPHVRMTNATPPPIVEVRQNLLLLAVRRGGDPTRRGGPRFVRGATGVMGEGTGFGGGRVVSVSMAARRELGRQFVGEMFLHPSLLFAGDALFSGAGVSRGGGVVSIGFVGFVGLGGVVVPVRFFHGGREGFSSMGRRRFAVLFARFGRSGRSRRRLAFVRRRFLRLLARSGLRSRSRFVSRSGRVLLPVGGRVGRSGPGFAPGVSAAAAMERFGVPGASPAFAPGGSDGGGIFRDFSRSTSTPR
mmetsp:Transcript_27604/g.57155  ORF Transcript_27604/g.57155 Transcript_27604/m.57155 type:complete len:439 (+) Transcript_27604:1352-2668(+)